MDDSGRRFDRWRIVLGIFGSILLISTLDSLFGEINYDWWSFCLALANLGAAYFGFANRSRFWVLLAVVWSGLDLLVVAWTILMIFLRHVVSTGNWDFNAIH